MVENLLVNSPTGETQERNLCPIVQIGTIPALPRQKNVSQC